MKGAFYAEISLEFKTHTPHFHWNSRGKGRVSEWESEGEGNKKDGMKRKIKRLKVPEGDGD